MLKGLEGDCQEKEEKRVNQVEGSACEKAQRYETHGTPGKMVASSFSWRVFGEVMPNYKWLHSLA